MRSLVAALRTLVLPAGATSGTRIVLDGVAGRISIYNADGLLIGQISPAANDAGPEALDGNIAFTNDSGDFSLMDWLGWIAGNNNDGDASNIDIFRFGSGTNGVAIVSLHPGGGESLDLSQAEIKAEWATHFVSQQPVLTLTSPGFGALIRLIAQWQGHPGVILLDADIIDADRVLIQSGKTFQAGRAGVTPSTADSNAALGSFFRGSTNVVFARPFQAAPSVVVTADSSVPGTVLEVSCNNVTTTGFTINLARTNQTVTGVYWQAMARTD